MNREELLKQINEYLKSLPNDSERYNFLDDIDCCSGCGNLIRPCYCDSDYDE